MGNLSRLGLTITIEVERLTRLNREGGIRTRILVRPIDTPSRARVVQIAVLIRPFLDTEDLIIPLRLVNQARPDIDGFGGIVAASKHLTRDNRGIGQHVAFLSYTYEEYASLPQTPTSDELFDKIIDKHPLVEIHFCGNRYQYKNLVDELNAQIRAGKFQSESK